ncbi:MAG: LPS export ABC transporter periplasmic protein LptC [Odoribacteraceae bacterium]|jgi:LPS export ABC transporter protein LptC|nr:LPS export ABC transporter periplasmic protein LptC [Odoribacteraceae bacterium]
MNHLPALLLFLLALQACKTDMREINKIMNRENMPALSGENMQMWYTDSARLKYRVITPRYDKFTDERAYEEFPLGLYVTSHDATGAITGTLQSRYAKRVENQNLWEIRDSVIVTNAEGKRLETDLLYWDMDKEWIYTAQPVRLTSGDQVIEGNNGFESDQQLNTPIFKKVSGRLELENQP